MSQIYLDVHCNFYGVGQGLFSAGSIDAELHGNGLKKQERFIWVYDCGTSSQKKFMTASISEFSKDFFGSFDANQDFIDLLMVSHFDKDHISGLCDLLARFKVRRIVLPHIPLWRRLIWCAFLGQPYNSVVYQFLLDPVKFITSKSKNFQPHIIFVPPSTGAEFVGQAGESPDFNNDEGLIIDVDGDDDVPFYFDEESVDAEQIKNWSKKCKLTFLKKGGALRIRGIWEFVPYNSDWNKNLVTPAFRVLVESMARSFLKAKNGSDREKFLDDIKGEYDRLFGSGQGPRNRISLFVYAGSILKGEYRSYYFIRSFWPVSHVATNKRPNGRISVLYTGDGYLDSPVEFDAMRYVFGQARMGEVGIFQVMHHGSKYNWYQGLAEQISPDLSIFSSNSNDAGNGHPHGEVVRDFMCYIPLQADRGKHVKIRTHLHS